MRPFLAVCLVAVFAVACARTPVPFAVEQPRDALYSGLVGRWHGTRVVADSSPAAGRVEVTDLFVVPAPDRDGLELRYRTRGETRGGARSIGLSFGHWHFARGLEVAQLGAADGQQAHTFRVVEQRGGRNGAPLQLVLEADGKEQARPARIRQQIDVSTGILRIRKDVQVGDGDFTFQEAFVFRRAE